MSADNTDDAPLEVRFVQSKEELNKQIVAEKQHHQRHNKNAKKRKPRWAKSAQQKALKASHFKKDDFKDGHLKEPQTKKRRLNTWMEESDLFHNVKESEKKLKEIDDTENVQIEGEIDDSNEDVTHEEGVEEEHEQVPQEIIDLFEKAVKESKTEQEIEDKWQQIIEQQGEKYAHLKHKLSKFDKVFKHGFQIEVDGVYRLNVSALKRALRMKHFSTKKHHRTGYSRQKCSGSTQPSFAFVKQSVNRKYDLKNKTFKPSSFWGKKLDNMAKAASKDELQKWLNM